MVLLWVTSLWSSLCFASLLPFTLASPSPVCSVSLVLLLGCFPPWQLASPLTVMALFLTVLVALRRWFPRSHLVCVTTPTPWMLQETPLLLLARASQLGQQPWLQLPSLVATAPAVTSSLQTCLFW